jgi:predicted TIM-barrel fold metal-dependent hydrolase
MPDCCWADAVAIAQLITRNPTMRTGRGPREFALNPAHYSLPTREELVAMRIWDIHYHGLSDGDFRRHDETMFYIERMGIERVLSLDIAGSPSDPLGSMVSAEARRAIRRFLERNADRVSGLIPIDPAQPEESCRKIKDWIRDGPCVGIKYYGGNPGGVTCSHPNNDAIIKLAAELKAIVYIHTWKIVGGNPRRPGGGNNSGESTPSDVALLAERFPDVPLICGHSGGDWELGVRAVRRRPNVFIEFSGSDPHSGQVDYTVSQLSADRLVWGGHGPTRSYSTELSKVLDADLNETQRRQIFGGNLRQIAGPIFRRKGYPLDP